MATRPAYVWTGSDFDEIGDKRLGPSVTALNAALAAKADYALPVNAQTGTTYTFVLGDARELTSASNAAAVTLTIPPQTDVTWAAQSVLRVVNYGAGAVTVEGGIGVTVTNTATTLAQFQSAAAIRTAEDAWTLVPFAGGGGVDDADFSNASTGAYTDGDGVSYKYVRFTSSGTLTVTSAGVLDVLVIGGGGGGGLAGGFDTGGGGGAGGFVERFGYHVTGNQTVTIGAGGARGNVGNVSLFRNAGALGGILVLGGGDGADSPSIGGDCRSGTSGASGGGRSGNASVCVPGVGLHSQLQGNNGGSSTTSRTAGGGAGGAASGTTAGAGRANSFTGTSVTYSTGGPITSSTGAANTGNGGGQAAGGSGVVVVRVRT